LGSFCQNWGIADRLFRQHASASFCQNEPNDPYTEEKAVSSSGEPTAPQQGAVRPSGHSAARRRSAGHRSKKDV
jgi:hypothetical protein